MKDFILHNSKKIQHYMDGLKLEQRRLNFFEIYNNSESEYV